MSHPENNKTSEVQELTWAMLDDLITDRQFQRLEQLLSSDDEAREVYVECIQLHADLAQHFAGTKPPGLPLQLHLPLTPDGGFAADVM
jgi:hypothetical protein